MSLMQFNIMPMQMKIDTYSTTNVYMYGGTLLFLRRIDEQGIDSHFVMHQHHSTNIKVSTREWYSFGRLTGAELI